MEIYKSEDYMKERLLYEADFAKVIKDRFDNNLFDDRETLCYDITLACAHLYQSEKNISQQYDSQNTKINDFKWNKLTYDKTKGIFIHANAIFGNSVFCSPKECHSCAYQFVARAKFPCNLVFGKINPYQTGDGLFHSVATFDIEERKFVFDGASFMIMSKELYDNLFHFTAEQTLDRETVRKDRTNFACSTLKSNAKYKLCNPRNVYKRFAGFGFIVYLSSRKDFIQNSDKQLSNFKQAMKEFRKFNKKLKAKNKSNDNNMNNDLDR